MQWKQVVQPILTLDLTSIREDSNSPFPHLHFMRAVKSVLCNVSFARKITSPSPVVPLLNQRLEELYWDEVAGVLFAWKQGILHQVVSQRPSVLIVELDIMWLFVKTLRSLSNLVVQELN